jgi:hypothetical protein
MTQAIKQYKFCCGLTSLLLRLHSLLVIKFEHNNSRHYFPSINTFCCRHEIQNEEFLVANEKQFIICREFSTNEALRSVKIFFITEVTGKTTLNSLHIICCCGMERGEEMTINFLEKGLKL